MQIDTNKYRLKRDPSNTDYSDITASVLDPSGPVWSQTTENLLILPFTPEPSQAEQDLIVLRLSTVDAAQETLFRQAQTAISNDAAWRTGQAAQIIAGAQTIEGRTGSQSTATLSTDARSSAQGIRLLTQQVQALSAQNEQLMTIVRDLLNAQIGPMGGAAAQKGH